MRTLATTQRYMHLSPAALDAAIRLLGTGDEFRGEIMEAAGKIDPIRLVRLRASRYGATAFA